MNIFLSVYFQPFEDKDLLVLNKPSGIEVDGSGNVYVVDYSGTSNVQKFDSNGNFITKLLEGSWGSGDGQFKEPRDISLDGSGNIYLVERLGPRVQKFDSSGNFITKWGTQGSGDGEFYQPAGIAIDGSGYVYVSDSSNYRVQKFTLGE